MVAGVLMLGCFASAGWAINPAGTYVYQEKGYTGTMVIEQQGPGFVFTFNTTSKSNGQQCDFQTYETPMDQGGGREDDDLPAKGGTEDDGIKFTIAFEGNKAVVDVESKGEECGMSGYFGGVYLKKTK
ncbi:hypothetical protein JCM14635_04670 [Megalodesulfovibrio paquesii]